MEGRQIRMDKFRVKKREVDNHCKRLDKNEKKKDWKSVHFMCFLAFFFSFYIFRCFRCICAVLETLMHQDILFFQSLRMSALFLVSDY